MKEINPSEFKEFLRNPDKKTMDEKIEQIEKRAAEIQEKLDRIQRNQSVIENIYVDRIRKLEMIKWEAMKLLKEVDDLEIQGSNIWMISVKLDSLIKAYEKEEN